MCLISLTIMVRSLNNMARPRLPQPANGGAPKNGNLPSASHFALNVNGLHKDIKRVQLNTMRRQHDWKVLYLSDTRLCRQEETALFEKKLGVVHGEWSLGTPHVGGTAILFFMPVNVIYSYNDPGGRFSRIDYVWQDEQFSSICVYAPAQPIARKRFLSVDLLNHLTAKPPHDQLLMAGDWNFVEQDGDRVSSNVDPLAGKHGSEEFKSLKQLLSLKDAFRNFRPSSRSFTFTSDHHKMASRIDRCYVSKEAFPFLADASHIALPSVLSDHKAGVEFTVRAVNALSRGKGYWKLNVSLMKRPGFKKIVDLTIEEMCKKKEAYPSLCSWWEDLKLTLQERLIPYSKDQAFRRKRTIEAMEKELLAVSDAISLNPANSAVLLERRTKLDSMLADYNQDLHAFAMLRAGSKHHVESQRPTAYFSSLVKTRTQKSAITELADRDGNVATDTNGLLGVACDFYSGLYARKSTDGAEQESFLSKINSRLSEADCAFCEQPLSASELRAALQKLPSGKCPGIDGLPTEFFRTFWLQLATPFLQLMQECFRTGQLPLTMRTSVITLIYKKGARSSIKNYRPISLLCSDYKIIAKALAERMRSVSASIIHEDQTGFVPNRYIGENIVSFLDTQEYLEHAQRPGYAFLADIEKAYDSVCRQYLEKCLATFGFGHNFIRWFHILHTASVAKVTIAGFLSESFDVISGVRQGCPWAPLLFLCATESLACNIRSSTIQGIRLPNGDSLLYKGYADDTVCYSESYEDLTVMTAIFHAFQTSSGLCLNKGKSVIVPLGSAKLMPRPSQSSFRWLGEDESERMLGIQVGLDYDDTPTSETLVTKVHSTIKKWIPKHLSLFERVVAAKGYIASKTWYAASAVPPQERFLSRISAMLWNFVQNNKAFEEECGSNKRFSRWQQQTLLQPFQAGGINMQDYEVQLQATHASWIFKLLNPCFSQKWKVLPRYFLTQSGLQDAIFISHPSVLKSYFPSNRWALYLRAWLLSNLNVAQPPSDFECILNEALWYNRFILDANGVPYKPPKSAVLLTNPPPIFIADIVARDSASVVTTSKLRFLDAPELYIKHGPRMAQQILRIIPSISVYWRKCLTAKIREAFQRDEWVVLRSEAVRTPPTKIFRIIDTSIRGKIMAEPHILSKTCRIAESSHVGPPEVLLLKANVVKAIVIGFAPRSSSKNAKASLYYTGNYMTSKLLLSRITWSTGQHFNKSPEADRVPFEQFQVKSIYHAIMSVRDTTIRSFTNWVSTVPNHHFDWHEIMMYIHDTKLDSRARQILYKICTRAMMVGTRVKHFGHSEMCAGCDDLRVEDVFHCLLHCKRLRDAWIRFRNFISTHYTISCSSMIQFNDFELLFGYTKQIPKNLILPWKILHAEFIRIIWYTRNDIVFKNIHASTEEIIAKLQFYVQKMVNINLYNLKISRLGRVKRRKSVQSYIRLWTSDVPVCTLDTKGRLILNRISASD